MCLYVCVSYVCVGELWCIVYMCGSEVYSMYTCGLWCVYCVVYGTRVYVYVVYAVCMCVCGDGGGQTLGGEHTAEYMDIVL